MLFAVLFIPIQHFPHLFMHEIQHRFTRFVSVPLHLRLIWIIAYNQQFPFYSYVLQDKAQQIDFFLAFASTMYEKKNWKCNLMCIKLKQQGWLWIYFHFYSFYHCNVGKSCVSVLNYRMNLLSVHWIADLLSIFGSFIFLSLGNHSVNGYVWIDWT